LWDIPTIFAILELNSMMPVTGGYYQWVKRALGLRWACYEGWWTWLYTFADLAIYPVMFVEYLSFFYPEAEVYKIPICLAIIWVSAGVNILGIVPVGKISIVLSVLVLIPFLILFGCSFVQHHGHIIFPKPSFEHSSFSTVSFGLYTVMWNFIGWDNVTTYAEEVKKPVRSYLISIAIAFIAVFTIYFIAILIAINSGINPETLENWWKYFGQRCCFWRNGKCIRIIFCCTSFSVAYSGSDVGRQIAAGKIESTASEI
jgi:amino acid transporter